MMEKQLSFKKTTAKLFNYFRVHLCICWLADINDCGSFYCSLLMTMMLHMLLYEWMQSAMPLIWACNKFIIYFKFYFFLLCCDPDLPAHYKIIHLSLEYFLHGNFFDYLCCCSHNFVNENMNTVSWTTYLLLLGEFIVALLFQYLARDMMLNRQTPNKLRQVYSLSHSHLFIYVYKCLQRIYLELVQFVF